MQLTPKDITNKKILISPLDWGMGHTTRCIVLIRQLQNQKNRIFFAGNDAQISLMKREFPQLDFLFLEGYNVHFDSEKSSYLQILNQLMKIKSAIHSENVRIKELVKQHSIEFIISDNRYGLFTDTTKNILLTHQLSLQIPYLKNWVNAQFRKWIHKFDVCWIPDSESEMLCGNLIQANLKIPKIFIGRLCRFYTENLPVRFDFLGIVSGPEPERSNFARLLDNYLSKLGKKVALVGHRGQFTATHYFQNPTSAELQNLINSSEIIISRAGYTTIMELVGLDKKAILIPTPGQFEQEYLSKNINRKKIIFKTQAELFNDKTTKL